MIRKDKVKRNIFVLLGEIAKKNRENYKHIIDECETHGEEIIYLGNGKDEDGPIHLLKWNIIYNIIYDTDGSAINLIDEYDYFELSNHFEKELEEAKNELNRILNKTIKEETETIKKLKKLTAEWATSPAIHFCLK